MSPCHNWMFDKAIPLGAAPVMRWIGLFRALGWYALAPFLVYSVLAAFRAKDENRRFQLIFLSLAVWVWAIIAATCVLPTSVLVPVMNRPRMARRSSPQIDSIKIRSTIKIKRATT